MELRSLRSKFGAILWICTLQFFLAEQIVQSAWRMASYSFARNYVSDLGAVLCSAAVCSPLHAVMNASFVLQGLLIAGGAILLREVFAPRRWYGVALLLCVLCGAGVTIVGLAPEDVRDGLHVVGATAHFICGGLSMLVLGMMMLRDRRAGSSAGWISVAMGLLVLVTTVLLGLRGTPVWNAVGTEVGAVERVAAYAIPLWFAGCGAGLLIRKAGESDSAPSLREATSSL